MTIWRWKPLVLESTLFQKTQDERGSNFIKPSQGPRMGILIWLSKDCGFSKAGDRGVAICDLLVCITYSTELMYTSDMLMPLGGMQRLRISALFKCVLRWNLARFSCAQLLPWILNDPNRSSPMSSRCRVKACHLPSHYRVAHVIAAAMPNPRKK